MNKKQWKKIIAARERLGLGERAALADIKRAYRRLSKKYHPDATENRASGPSGGSDFMALTEAYQTLLAYCASYRFPLTPEDEGAVDPEDWWMDRFGQDPLWGSQKPE